MDTETNSNVVSRREILKRGAFVGGAVLWVTPVVQAVGMGRAYAKDVSTGCYRYCIKWDAGGSNLPPDVNPPLTCTDNGANAYPVWGNVWTELGKPPPEKANALTCVDTGGANDLASAEFITAKRTGRKFVVYGDQTNGFWVAFPPDIKLAYLADVNLYSVGAKCGQTLARFTPEVKVDPCYTDPDGVPFNRIHIPAYCGSGSNGISHIEMIVDWCPNGAQPN